MLRLRCSTAVAVLVWASALHAADPQPIAQAPAPAPGGVAPGDTAAFPPIEPLPSPDPQALAPAPLPAPEAPKEEKPSLPDKVGFGKNGGFFQPGGFIQIFGLATHADNAKTATTLRLRRAEFTLKGEILPKQLAYRVMFDVAKTTAFTNTNVPVATGNPDVPSPGNVSVPQPGADRSPLQDAWISYLSDYADVTIGQFKIPVSLEALQPTGRTLFPERSRVTSAFGDRRDVGVRVDKKIADVFYYNVAIFNGQGQTVVDADRAKDLALRLEAYPIPGLTVAAATYGTVFAGNGMQRNRVEGDLRLEMSDLIVQGEYIHAWTGTHSRKLEGHGAYGAVAYTIEQHFQPAARVGFVDLNIDDLPSTAVAETGVQRQFEIGLNYLVKGYDAKLTGSFAFYSQEHGLDTKEFTLQAVAGF